MTSISVVQSDYGYLITFALINSDGSVFDLTGNTSLLFKAQQTNKTEVKFSGTMSVVGSPTAGTCSYQVASGNFSNSGVYNAQIQVSFFGEVITFPNIQITTISKLPV